MGRSIEAITDQNGVPPAHPALARAFRFRVWLGFIRFGGPTGPIVVHARQIGGTVRAADR